MAALAFSTTIRDRVCYLVYSAAYSGLTTEQKAIVDGAGVDALAVLTGIGKYFPDVLTTTVGTWDAWLVSETCAIVAENKGDGRAEMFRKRADRDKETALQTYDFDTSANNTTGSLTLLEIRKYVAGNLVRRGIYPPLTMIDWAAQWAIGHVWNMKNWAFKQRPVTIAIATNSTVTVSDSVSMDSLNTAKLWYTDSAGTGMFIEWAGAEDMASKRATTTTTGRPSKFRVYWDSGTLKWQFWPAPDQAYTVRTEALIVGPPAITDETSTTPFAHFPAAFTPGLLDLVLAKVLKNLGVAEGDRRLDDAEENVQALFPQYESIGKPVTDGWSVRDVYGDVLDVTANNGWC